MSYCYSWISCLYKPQWFSSHLLSVLVRNCWYLILNFLQLFWFHFRINSFKYRIQSYPRGQFSFLVITQAVWTFNDIGSFNYLLFEFYNFLIWRIPIFLSSVSTITTIISGLFSFPEFNWPTKDYSLQLGYRKRSFDWLANYYNYIVHTWCTPFKFSRNLKFWGNFRKLDFLYILRLYCVQFVFSQNSCAKFEILGHFEKFDFLGHAMIILCTLCALKISSPNLKLWAILRNFPSWDILWLYCVHFVLSQNSSAKFEILSHFEKFDFLGHAMIILCTLCADSKFQREIWNYGPFGEIYPQARFYSISRAECHIQIRHSKIFVIWESSFSESWIVPCSVTDTWLSYKSKLDGRVKFFSIRPSNLHSWLLWRGFRWELTVRPVDAHPKIASAAATVKIWSIRTL